MHSTKEQGKISVAMLLLVYCVLIFYEQTVIEL